MSGMTAGRPSGKFTEGGAGRPSGKFTEGGQTRSSSPIAGGVHWTALSDEGIWRLQRLAFPLSLGFTPKEIGECLEESSAWVSSQLAELRAELQRVGSVSE